MICPLDAYRYFGAPGSREAAAHLTMWDVPTALEIGIIPKRIYCAKVMIQPLTCAFHNLIQRDLIHELRTWDGCYNFRPIRGLEERYKKLMAEDRVELAIDCLSLHSWAIAIDVDAAWNRLGAKPTMKPEVVDCFVDAGFEWGGYWTRPDGMHFQLRELPM